MAYEFIAFLLRLQANRFSYSGHYNILFVIKLPFNSVRLSVFMILVYFVISTFFSSSSSTKNNNSTLFYRLCNTIVRFHLSVRIWGCTYFGYWKKWKRIQVHIWVCTYFGYWNNWKRIWVCTCFSFWNNKPIRNKWRKCMLPKIVPVFFNFLFGVGGGNSNNKLDLWVKHNMHFKLRLRNYTESCLGQP